MEQGSANNVVQIFDTTLRDGEQSPGASMTVEQKVVIARQLEKLGVDVIEAGFAASSDGDFDSVCRVCKEVSRPRVVSLARAQEGDINRALKAVEDAKNPGIHTFIATSDIHLKHKLRMTREQVVEAAVKAVSHAKKFMDYVEFSAEDASRSDPDFLMQVFREVIRAGAKVINVPDTTGYAIPSEFGALIANLIRGWRPGHLERPLPQRFGLGRGQLLGCSAQRRPPNRMHHKRHRRARRQYFIGRSGDGAAHAQKLSRPRHQYRERAALSDLPLGFAGYRHRDSDQ